MAIHNINTLVNSDLLEHLTSGKKDYISKYYNEALANLGQRNTKEDILGYESFSLLNILEVLIGNTEIEKLKSIKKSNKTWIELIYCIDGDKKYIQLNTIDNNQVYILSTDLSLQTNNDNHITVLRKLGQDNDSVLTNYKIDILLELFNKIYENELQDKSSSNEIKKYKCYISTEYNIYILKNRINETIIYGSYNPIYVHFGLNSNNEQDINLVNDAINVISNLSYIKFSLYTFEFNYRNEDNPEIIYTKYDLPYIDKSIDDNTYKWFINGDNTYINAEAKEAMNLNIIVCYQYQNAQIKILSGLNDYYNQDIIDSIKIENVKINWISGDILYCDFYLPNINDIDDKYTQYIQNSLVFHISKISSLGLDSKYLNETKHLLDNGCFTTLWRFDKDNDNWEPLTLVNNGPILDFNEITNFNNLLEYKINKINQIEPDNFLFTRLIFDDVIKTNKHDNQTSFLYPVLQNISGIEYDNRYINNLNFSLRYMNNIEGKIGQNIVKVSNTLSDSFLKMNNISSNNTNTLVTNSIYKYTLNNKTNYYNEYIPNYNIPLFDMSEFLIKDFNTINRQNIITFNSNGNLYYSYIGTSFNEFDKNTLHIGTSTTNINLGEYSLTTSADKQLFKKQNILSLDFDNTYINGNNLKVDATTYINKKTHFNDLKWDVKTFKELGNIKNIYSTSLSLPFKYYLYNNQLYYNVINLKDLNILKSIYNDIKYNIDRDKNELYLNIILSVDHNGITYYYKYNDLLIIDKLLKYLGINNNRINIYSNTNDIIYINDNGENKPAFMISSGNMLSQYINITDSSENGMSININKIPSSFFGNTLDINIIGDIYGNNNEILEITINESHTNTLKSIWQIPLNY